MRPRELDPTAGETAREARAHPDAMRRVLDPTDPRFGTLAAPGGTRQVPRIVDPTDPEYDRQPA